MKKEILTAGALVVASSVFGAGFQILEQGASNMGSAMAGATANASGDSSSAFWNPSASFFSGLEVGEIRADSAISFVMPTFEFKGSAKATINATGTELPVAGNDGGNGGEVAYVPNFYSLYRFHEDFILSFSSTSTYGLETDYDEGWVGRYMAMNSDLLTIDVNPSIAWKVNDWFSISAGAAANYLHAYLTQMVPTDFNPANDRRIRFSGDSWSAGATVGFTIKYAEGGRFAASWRSEVEHDVSGNRKLGNSLAPIDAELTLPQTVNVGIYQRLWGDLDRFAVMIDYAWTGWSCFKQLDIRYSDGSSASGEPVDENWKDTSRVAFGVHYYPEFDENLVFRFGTAWDESPVRNSEYRTARIPCADRVWLSGGLGYTYGNLSFNLGYMYIIFYNDAPINNSHNNTTITNSISGKYTGDAHVLSLQAGIKF